LESADSSIKPGQPIPLKRVTEAFEKMRGGGNDRSRGQSSGSDDDGLSAELLVPGFGVELEPPQLMGFGPTAEMLSVTVTDEDREEASERMRRYDRNRDGVLTPNELQRFSGNPMDFDRNKDGKLSERELAVRYARRRESREDSRDNDRDRRRDRDRDRDVEPPDVYDGRKSYRATAGRELPEGVPGFFADKDSNGDGQVEMAEFATKWNDETVREFFRSDLNRDGIITAEEALRAVEEGDDQAPSSDQTASSSASTDGSESSGGTIGEPDAKMIAYAERIVSRQDENKDGKLTPSEWKKMLLSPADADADRDGTITVKEYAWWMQSRSKR
jgi:Ca2+-binding EF-hand superfamily protein